MSKQTRMIRLTAALGLAGWIGTAHAQQAAPGAAGNAARGHALFMSAGCYECHGTVGQGGVGLRLAPFPLPTSAIAAYLRDPTGEMPPYTSAVVSDADIRDIHAYLSSIPAARAVVDIPQLQLGERN